MLNPREANIPETCAKTPGWFWTSAERTCRIRPDPRTLLLGPALAVVDSAPIAHQSPCSRGRTGVSPQVGQSRNTPGELNRLIPLPRSRKGVYDPSRRGTAGRLEHR